jgi:hypothetical protein
MKVEEIVEEALSYVGQREKKGNSGFLDPKFEAEMREEGWQYGWAWCAVFGKVVFKNVYPERAEELNDLFSPSAVTTFNNFKKAGYHINTLPEVGNMVVWQTMKEGKPQATGHLGIVVKLNNSWRFQSVEGNGNDEGGREGVEVALQLDRATKKDVWNGLKVLGFVRI